MGWASSLIGRLKTGETVQFRPRGNSMTGKVESGSLVTVEPLSTDVDPEIGDIVLCTVRGKQYLHLIKAVREKQFQIGNNKGRINGWVSRRNIHGICTKIEP